MRPVISKLVDDVLNVLKEIGMQYTGDSGIEAVRQLRISAAGRVAKRRGVLRSVIDDALRRRIGLKSVPNNFDPLVSSWLSGDSNRLRVVLDRAALDDNDSRSIHDFMSQAVLGPRNVSVTQVTAKKPVANKRQSKRPRERTPAKTIAVELDADVAKVFTNSNSVNNALRALIRIAKSAQGP